MRLFLDQHKNSDNKASLHILGVDRRVQLMGKGNDIDLERFFKEAAQFGVKNEANVTGTLDERYDKLSKYNTFIITNAYETSNSVDCAITLRNAGVGPKATEDDDQSGLEQSAIVTDAASIDEYVRKDFPEIFIFEDISEVENLQYHLNRKVPDTIGKFMVNAFVFHPLHGLGIADEKSFTVFKEFFVETYLPYSIYIGEILNLNIVVFHYIEKIPANIDANVKIEIIENSAKGEFVVIDSKCKATPKREKIITEIVKNIPYDKSGNVKIPIRATKSGYLTIKITAITNGRNDVIEKKLLVEQSGRRIIDNELHYISFENKSDNFNFDSLEIKSDAIIESISIYGHVYGNVLGQVLEVKDLIMKPQGCPEQTFSSWIPNIVAYNYLKSINKLDDDTKKYIRGNLTSKYSDLMKLAKIHNDGSFPHWSHWTIFWTYVNSFANNEKSSKPPGNGNDRIWMTAYFVNLLTSAKVIIVANETYVVKALKFLKAHQVKSSNVTSNGGFKGDNMNGYFDVNDDQGSIALTAYVVSAIIETKYEDNDEDYKKVVENGIDFLKSNTINLKNPFAIALTAYTLSSKNDTSIITSSKSLLDKLEKTAEQPNRNQMFWNIKDNSEKMSPMKIETASYAMMAFMNIAKSSVKDDTYKKTALKILNWLISQKNSQGGFQTTTDTVTAVGALAKVSEIFKTIENDMTIELKYNGPSELITLTKENSHKVHNLKFEKKAKDFKFNANGTGNAVISLTYDFFVPINELTAGASYLLSVTKNFINNRNCLELTIFVSSKKNGPDPVMPLIEINLPSGFEFEDEQKIYDNLNKKYKMNVKVKIYLQKK